MSSELKFDPNSPMAMGNTSHGADVPFGQNPCALADARLWPAICAGAGALLCVELQAWQVADATEGQKPCKAATSACQHSTGQAGRTAFDRSKLLPEPLAALSVA